MHFPHCSLPRTNSALESGRWIHCGSLLNLEEQGGAVALCNTTMKIPIPKIQSNTTVFPFFRSTILENVKGLKLQILKMHHSKSVGLSSVQIWAFPGEKAPPEVFHKWRNLRSVQKPSLTKHCPTNLFAPLPLFSSQNKEKTSIIEEVLNPIQRTPDEEATIPSRFIDPITLELMRDPICLPCKQIVDRSTIQRHLELSKTDPFTGLILLRHQIEADLKLKFEIQQFLSKRDTDQSQKKIASQKRKMDIFQENHQKFGKK